MPGYTSKYVVSPADVVRFYHALRDEQLQLSPIQLGNGLVDGNKGPRSESHSPTAAPSRDGR